MTASACPALSVIIPLHDKAAYVLEAIESVLAQQPAAAEILVIDDGSTDGGPERVERWIAGHEAGRIVRLLRQANAGVSVARNRGIDLARGELVTFLDADDRYLPGYFAMLAALAAAHPQAGMYCTGFARRWPDGRRVLSGSPGRPARPEGSLGRVDSFHDWWSRGAFTHTNSIALRRELLQRDPSLRFMPGERLGEDQDLWLRVAEAAPVAFANVPLTEYRMDVAGSAMQNPALADVLPCYQRLARRLQSGAVPEALRDGARQLLSVHRINVASARLDRGDPAGAAQLLFSSGASARRIYWLRTVLRWAVQRLGPGLRLRSGQDARRPRTEN